MNRNEASEIGDRGGLYCMWPNRVYASTLACLVMEHRAISTSRSSNAIYHHRRCSLQSLSRSSIVTPEVRLRDDTSTAMVSYQ